jgi:electron transport complex protein RnfC
MFSVLPDGTSSFTPAPDRSLSSIDNLRCDDLGDWIARLTDARIVANRRACPNLLGQLSQTLRRPIDTVICNLLDSDPAAALNLELAREYATEVLAGVLLCSKLTGAAKTWIAVDETKASSDRLSLRHACKHTGARVITMANDYPQADPTLLLYTLLGRRLRPGRLPVEQGVLVLDGAAAFAIGRVALLNEPMTHVPLVVRDHTTLRADRRAHYVLAQLGTSIGNVLAALHLSLSDAMLRAGDLLRDIEITPDAPVSSGELVIHYSDAEPAVNPDPCIRCGWCLEACPTRVQPANVLDAAQRDDLDAGERAGVEACIECGICSYVCPAKLPLLDGLRYMRAKFAEDAAGE